MSSDTAESRERFRRDILLHAQELAAEMNLRLLLDGEVTKDRMLFVESVTVTGIAYPVKREKNLGERIQHALKKAFTYIGRLLHFGRGSAGHRAPKKLR